MKKFIRIISYIREYKAQMGWYSLCITLSILFGLFSLGMLMPFMDLIFGSSELTGALKTTTAVGGNQNIKDVIYSVTVRSENVGNSFLFETGLR